jgi:hypothetical protein
MRGDASRECVAPKNNSSLVEDVGLSVRRGVIRGVGS